MIADEISAMWDTLPERHQRAIATNFFPELIQDQPEPILRAIVRAIYEARGNPGDPCPNPCPMCGKERGE